jgi:N,N-dimethylformamidase beta subunit-like protein/VCBS repeat protein
LCAVATTRSASNKSAQLLLDRGDADRLRCDQVSTLHRAPHVLRLLSIFAILLMGCGARRPQAAVERNVAACARAADGLVCARWQGQAFGAASRWSPAFGYGDLAESSGSASAAFASPDLDGDGQSDVCINDRLGLLCALRSGPEAFGLDRRSTAFADADGFGDWSPASRIKFPDVDGDGLADACARGAGGLFCARGRGDGTFDTATRWAAAPFRNLDGSDAPDRYRTLRFGDLDGDGRDDVCMRTAADISCALARADRFADATPWSTRFAGATHANWELVDVDGDGRMDLCGVDGGQLACARSDGGRFVDGATSLPVAPAAAVRFADLDGDGRSDACIFASDGVGCALSDGQGFVPASTWHQEPAGGPAATITWLVDVDGDGRADLCQRNGTGLSCARSNGARFVPPGPTLADFGDDVIVDRALDLQTMSVGRHVGVNGGARNPIAVENQRPGARDWWVPYPQWSAEHEVEAYTDQLSYARGQRVRVMLSTATAGDAVTWTLYRTGWYGGRGARRIAQGHTSGNPQPLPPPVTKPSDVVRAHWTPSFSFLVPADAVSGVYALRLDSAATHKSFIVTFVVRDDARVSDLLFARADYTDEAYNAWDGSGNVSSLYLGARWVSFDRPLRSVGQLGIYSYSSGYFVYEYPMVRWLESQGYDVAYVSDVDVHRDAGVLAHARAFLSVGHDEYWSAAERDHVEAARDTGMHIGFFGSDLVDGLIRFQKGDARSFSRSISDTDPHKNEFAAFPLDPSRPPHANPSDSLTGTHYLDWCSVAFPACSADGAGKLRVADDMQIVEPAHPIFRGIDATSEPLPRVLGYEYEAPYFAPSHLPFSLHVLARAANVHVDTTAPVLVAYRASSGALVANLGSMHWAHALDPWVGRAAFRQSGGERSCDPGDDDCFTRPAGPAAQITTNILIDFGAVPTTPSSRLALSSSRAWP